MSEFLQQCRALVGAQNVITDSEDKFPYEQEWRQRQRGQSVAVVRPASSEEVAAVVRLCRQFQVPVVPQGGNTGLVMGSIPDQSGTAIILSLQRMKQIRAIDAANNTLVAEAGCSLLQVQQAALGENRLFPLSLASEGSCSIGGNLSTNAGGTAVLRYGNARELCLGLEVVTASGEIWHGLRGLRKDNTGYDLKDLFIGAEGTLGIITAAVLKLFPLPIARQTAYIAVNSTADALALFSTAMHSFGPALTGFELISDICSELVQKHTGLARPVNTPAPYDILLEISEHHSAQHAAEAMEQFLERAFEAELISDAALASSLKDAEHFWQLRENISTAQAREGKNIKHDISIPISSIPEFIEATEKLLLQHFPACRLVCFGHMGDGNLHFNVSGPTGSDSEAFLQKQADINQLVHDQVQRFNGSISAEHGIGTLKRDEMPRYKSALEMQLMRSLKQAFDPDNLMNPGKIL